MLFRFADLLAIILFFIAMTAMGIYFARKNTSTEEYFLGNRAFPSWAIGLSMLGTSISSVTFLAFPAAAFALDYRQVVQNLTLPVAAVLAVIFFIPFFRQCASASAFEYLEQRYGLAIRTYAAFSFVILNLVRLATVLYLISIPLAEMFGIPILWIILICGVVVGAYTVLGGIEAVIWTDVVQTIILLGGGVLCLGLIVCELPGGLPQIIEVGRECGKFSLGPMSWTLNERTFPVMILLGLVSFTTEYSSNQNVVQRYIAAKSLAAARRATWLCTVMSIPTWLLFFFIGTCLFVFYRVFPAEAIQSCAPEEVLPYFILTNSPPFVGGIIIAACIAAAMSSLDSAINAIATVCTIDFVKRLGKERSDREHLRIAKLISCGAGAVMIGGAILINHVPKESMVDLGIILGSLFGGGILSIFLLGFFTTRVGNRAIITGTCVALAFNIYLMFNTFQWLPASLALPVHSYWTTILVNALLFAAAYLLSWFMPNRRDLAGLTVWTRRS